MGVSRGDGGLPPDASTAEVPDGRSAAEPDRPQPAPLERGALVDRYVILDLVGQGSMGCVYKAYDPKLERTIALKLLPAGEDRFVREAQALARLSHPNVVAVYDAGTAIQGIFVAMEFVPGRTLRAWLSERARKPRDILAAFLAAGEGLAAAHRAGVIHRDFKPENVVVGDDGRIRVLDFGVARAGARDIAPAGTVLGTPRYMAPEQHLGQTTDERTDQYNFCMALYEALYGALPFPASTLAELREATTQDRLVDPPADAQVPRWLRRVLLQGVRAHPDQRHASMEALLQALRQDPRAAWQRRSLVAVALALLALLGVRTFGAGDQTCSGAERRLAGVWDDGVRERVGRALLATGDPSAAQIWASVRQGLDGYAAEWRHVHHEACVETRVRRERPESVLALETACLDVRLKELDAIVGLLETSDRELARRSLEAVSRLSSIRECTDIAALTAPVPPPNAAVAAEVDALRAQIAKARVLNLAGRYQDGIDLAARAGAAAEKLHYLPVLAQALDVRGHGLTWLGKPADAEPILVEAYAAAYEGRDHLQAARAATHLVGTVGVWLGREADGNRWARLALAAIGNIGGNDDLRAEVLGFQSNIYSIVTENGPAAVPLAREALALHERLLGPDAYATAVDHGRLASALYVNHELAASRAESEKAIAMFKQLLGPDHPYVASALSNLSETYYDEHDYETASSMTRQALGIHERALGPMHPSVATDLANLADDLLHLNRCAEAVPAFQRAVSIYSAALSPTDVRLSQPLGGLGECLRRLKRVSEARPPLERSVAICEQHPERKCAAEKRFLLAQTLWDLGERAQALELAHQSDPTDRDVQKWLQAHSR